MKKYLPYLLFLIAVLMVVFPWFSEGRILLLDMVFPPDMGIPQIVNGQIPSGYPLRAILYAKALILGGALTEKLLLLFILLLPCVSMYRFMKARVGLLFATVGALIYGFNPWVYERFLAGQWYVLLGYGVFPFFMYFLEKAFSNPSRKNIFYFALMLSLYPILSQHFAWIALAITLFYTLIFLLQYRKRISRFMLGRFVKGAALTVALLLLVNSFWLVSFFNTSTTFSNIGSEDFKAFATLPDDTLGLYPNVLSLYGFWDITVPLPKDSFPLWYGVTIFYILISIVGALILLRTKKTLPLFLVTVIIPVIIIGAGYSSEFSRSVISILAHIPGFKGLRDTEKVLGLLAFFYAFFVPWGLAKLSEVFSASGFPKSRYLLSGITSIFIGLSVSTMFFGFSGFIKPSVYPASWQEARTILSEDGGNRVLLLPWQKYLPISFAEGRRILNPSFSYFLPQGIGSTYAENAYLYHEGEDPYFLPVTYLVHAIEDRDTIIGDLKEDGITHILLIKEGNYEDYDFLGSLRSLSEVLEGEDIILYQIN